MTNSSSKYCITAGDILSEDLIYEILLRLPVKTLLRSKSVSKSWCSLITSTSFVESHLSATRPGDDETLIVLEKLDFVSFSLLHLGSCKLVADLKSPYSEGEISWNPYVIIIGSARGIVCVSVCDNRFENHLTKYTYLWNPATKESKLIPAPATTYHEITIFDDRRYNYYVPCGLGFDPIDNDFKVVRACRDYHTEIYSTNMNAWRIITSDISYYYSINMDFGVSVDRFLCWTTSAAIVAFDLNKEVFNSSTEFPNGFHNGTIAELNNSIVVIFYNEDIELKSSKFSVWMLDDVGCLGGAGGVEASWTLMLSIDTNVHMAIHCVCNFFDRGNLLLSGINGLFLYNTDKKESKKVPVASLWGHIFKYKESLVSITRSKQAECSSR